MHQAIICLAPLGAGWVIWREAKDLPEELIFNVNYLGGNIANIRTEFLALAVKSLLNIIISETGSRRLCKIHNACYATAQYLSREIEKLGPFEMIFDGDSQTGIPALAWKLKEGTATSKYSLYDIADKLRSRGWQVPAYPCQQTVKTLLFNVFLVRHGVSLDLAALLIDDFKRTLEYFDKHPVNKPLTEEEGGGFNHRILLFMIKG